MHNAENPFAGLLVVELASVLAGPSTGQFFAELGAQVLKIENVKTRGDVTRTWKTGLERPETDISAYFACANWGKKSVALDLAQPEAYNLFCRIADRADILIASYKPGDAQKLKVDYETLSARNPGLIYGHITGYGAEVNRAGYDAIVQAESGLMYLNGEAGGPPTKMPVAMVDILTAHQLKEGLLAALFRRERSGKGSLVQVSLIGSALASLANQASNYLVSGNNPKRMGSEHPNIVPYGSLFTTADEKQLVLAVGDDRQFRYLCDVLSIPEVAEQEEFRNNSCRVKNRELLLPILRERIRNYRREELLQRLQQRHVPAGAVYDVAEALQQPGATSLLLQDGQENSAFGKTGIRTIAFSWEVGLAEPARPPHYGEHTVKVLQEAAGVSDTEIAALLEKKVIFQQWPENHEG